MTDRLEDMACFSRAARVTAGYRRGRPLCCAEGSAKRTTGQAHGMQEKKEGKEHETV